jgi:arylsulfatase A-like enzyme
MINSPNMNRLLLVSFLLVSQLATFSQSRVKNANSSAVPAEHKKMNVVFFLVDDLGWSDIGINGSTFYETPNIDKFAKENVRFTQAYAACHVCSPTRGSILTGKYPARTGLTDWLPGRKDFPFQMLKNVRSVQHLPFEENTLAEVLHANGYRTAIYGKWHLGEEESSPLKHGFEERLTEWNKGWPLTYFPPYQLQGLEGGTEGEYLTDRVTSEALKYIEKNKDQPFFLYLSHFAVHDPIEGRPDLVKKYEKKLSERREENNSPFILEGNPDTINPLSAGKLKGLLKNKDYKGFGNLPNRTVKVKQVQDNVQFAAMVESMDESLGRVLAKLKELGLDENTVVIFVSDNGGMAAMNMGNPLKKISPAAVSKSFSTSNLPLRGAKGWLYEGGIRVPMIVRWPTQGKSGLVSDVPVISTDFYPSILDMLGLPAHPEQCKDGMSITPLLKEEKKAIKKLENRALYWHFPHYSNHGLQSPGGAVRYGDYKLIEYYEHNTVQLFNIKNDPGEQHDLSHTEFKKVKQLTEMLHQWRKDVAAQMPVPNPEYRSK